MIKEFLTSYIVPFGVVLTFFAAAANTYYTRKNLKTTKYIDIITSERIKWLSIIREEVAVLISIISETLLLYSKEIDVIESQNPSEEYIDEINYEYHRYSGDALNKDILKFGQEVIYQDLLKRLNILKLRLNPTEDLEIIIIIEYFVKLYNSKYVSCTTVKEANIKINELATKTQAMLKNEWEKIKRETQQK